MKFYLLFYTRFINNGRKKSPYPSVDRDFFAITVR